MKIFVAIVALALAGCASQSSDSVTLQRMPAWQLPSDPTIFSSLRVVAEVHLRVPGIPVNCADGSYTLVSRAWLDRFLDWQWQAAKAEGVEYTPESFDCDDFAVLTAELMSLAASRARVHAAPLVGRIVVQLNAIDRHELMAIGTDDGVVIVEPQPNAGPFRVTPLAKYAPRILSVTFGDYNPAMAYSR